MPDHLIYLRKSRADGEHETVEEVLARHEKILQEYAVKMLGEPLPESCIYREVVSGETIQDRPVIKNLLERIQNEPIKGVLTVEPQRLSRGDLSDCGTIIRAFRYTDTLVITPTKTYDLSDKFDRKFFEMELTRGNDYLEYVKEILMRGRIASVSEGNFIGSVPPYGYDKIKNGKSYTLVPNDEADTVRLIFELWVNQALGTTSIANRLNSLGIKPRKIEYWTNATIRDMLRNPVYIGKIRWNWRKTVKKYENGEIIKSRPKSDPESWMLTDGKHDPIISEELFNAAQERFGKSPRLKSEKQLVNPFAGLIRCECGRSMVYQPQRKSAARIHCPNQPRCGNKSAAYDEIEEEIISSLNRIISEFKVKIADGSGSPQQIRENIVQKLIKELNNIETQQDKLYELLEQGIYTNAVFLKRNAALAEKRRLISIALEDAEKTLPKAINYSEKIVQISQALALLQNPDAPIKLKNELLKKVIREIRYSRKTANRTKWDNTPVSLEVFLKF